MKLFGTDGIRGKSNQCPILPNTLICVGQALGQILNRQQESHHNHNNHKNSHYKKKQHVLIGKDTRLSGYMIEMALASGLNSVGVNVLLVGPLPTPGIGFLAKNMRAQAGIVISASHNPHYDNGIKIFDESGFKISRQWEQQIEEMLEKTSPQDMLVSSEKIGRSKRIDDATGRYIVHVKSHFPYNKTLDGMRIVLDCANGACYKVAPQILEELGAEVIVLHNQPDGFNINDKCGACYPEKIAHAVRQYRADLGISLDGDGDRVVLADHLGQVLNGDHILAISALYAKETNTLAHNTVVLTEMSNKGLEEFFEKNNIQVIKTDVGDRYVVEQMRKSGCYLGGEPSGHIILSKTATTGDGLIAALNILKIMKIKNKKLADLKCFQDKPHILHNLRFPQKIDLETVTGYPELIASIKNQIKPQGKIFIRFSGTEPILRISLQGESQTQLKGYAQKITTLLKKELA